MTKVKRIAVRIMLLGSLFKRFRFAAGCVHLLLLVAEFKAREVREVKGIAMRIILPGDASKRIRFAVGLVDVPQWVVQFWA